MASILNQKASSLGSILNQHRDEILREWIREMSAATRRGDLIKDSEVQEQCSRFIQQLSQAVSAAGTNVQSGAYDGMRELLSEISRSRAVQGFSAKETANFVFSMKRPFFTVIREELRNAASRRKCWNSRLQS